MKPLHLRVSGYGINRREGKQIGNERLMKKPPSYVRDPDETLESINRGVRIAGVRIA